MNKKNYHKINLSNGANGSVCPNKQKGITLIALIITIIVMLILVAVSVRIVVNSGLFKHAGEATKKWGDAQREEIDISKQVDRKVAEINGEWYLEEIITSPNYPEEYPNNVRISELKSYGPDVKNVLIKIVDVKLESGCRYDYLEIFRGNPEEAPLFARVCDGASGNFINEGNQFGYRFISDESNTYRGFKMYVYTTTAENYENLKIPDVILDEGSEENNLQ